MSLGNLWRKKLRAFLTISGVVIGIAALVSMMSYAAGIKKYVAEKFKSLELFNTIKVIALSLEEGPGEDSTAQRRILDDEAVAQFRAIPGVKSAFPEDTFPVKVEFEGKSEHTTAQALPASVGEIEAFRELMAGRFFQSDTAQEAVIHRRLMRKLEVESPDSILGREITVVTAKIDLASAIGSFLRGRAPQRPRFEQRRQFTVCGVTNVDAGMNFTLQRLIIPSGTAESMEKLSFSNPLQLMQQLTGGEGEGYPSVTVKARSLDHFDAVRDSVEALGFRTWSFAEHFEEQKKFFLIFDAMMGVVGFIALVVASLGIVNTMVMSISERRREIGILKSLGADNGAVRLLFLVEAGAIGFIGSALGIGFGWVITRIAWEIGKAFMRKQGIPIIDFFHTPAWLIAFALTFGVSLSLIAGLYPAGRAASVDPVKALRHD